MRWEGHVARIVEMRKAYNILVGKPEGKRPLRVPKIRWDDNIDVREIWWEGVDWIHVAEVWTWHGVF
jgi:hypothetical protein